MSRWLAPAIGGLSLLVMLAGLIRAETVAATTAGVSLVFWGLAGLVLAGAGAGVAELSARRAAHPRAAGPRAAGPPAPGARPPAARR
ncbi:MULTISPECIES: hypothetical protein [unclassified Blastococcus]